MRPMRVRTITPQDRSELADLIYVSLNYWYQTHGRPPTFTGGPKDADAFYEVYSTKSRRINGPSSLET